MGVDRGDAHGRGSGREEGEREEEWGRVQTTRVSSVGKVLMEADRWRTGEMTGARAGVSPAAAVRVRVRVRPARERGRIEVQVRRCAACGEDGREWVVDFGCVEVGARAWA